MISALLFLGSYAAFAIYAKDDSYRRRSLAFAAGMLVIAGLNASTLHGIQPIWTKGTIDRRDKLAAEVWNPISKSARVSAGIRTTADVGTQFPHAPRECARDSNGH